MERLKQTVECLRMRSSRRSASLHGFDETVAVVGERRHHGAGNRCLDARKIEYQDLNRDLAGIVAGGKKEEGECGHA